MFARTIDEVLVEGDEWSTIDEPDAAAPTTPLTGLPGGIERLEPGPMLAAALTTIDISRLSGADLTRLLPLLQKQISGFEAVVLIIISEIADVMVDEFGDDLAEAYEATALELRALLRITRRAADIQIGLAEELTSRLPAVGEALEQGLIDLPRARVLADQTTHLDQAQARQVVDRIIDRAPELTTGQLRARVRRLCLAIDSETAKKRYEAAVDQRRVVRDATVDAAANLMILNAPPHRADEAYNKIDRIAKGLQRPGETRTIDQLRTDVALDLLCGDSRQERAKGGTVNINVDLDTLAELAEHPGDLAGYGPVIADIARQVSETHLGSEWRYRVYDPETELPVATGTTRRRPNAAQKREVELRDQTCVFPGCRMPSTQCDLDHIKTWADTGRTSVDQLGPGCRHDHVRRHKYDWTYTPLSNGDYLWTSRLGLKHTTSGRPPPPDD